MPPVSVARTEEPMARTLWATALVAFAFTLTGCTVDENGGPCVVAISGCVASDASNSTDNGSVSTDAGSSDSSTSQPDSSVPKPEVSEQKDVVAMADCDKLDAAVGTCIAEISEFPVYIECVPNDAGKCALKVDGPGASFKGTFEDEDGDWPVISEGEQYRLVTDFDGKHTITFSKYKKVNGEFKFYSDMNCLKE